MKFYFLRHADALDGMDDESRPLSSRGRREAAAIGQFLKKAGVRFDAAYSSPLLRARETAEIILPLCVTGDKTKLQTADVLLNETPQVVFDRWFAALKAEHVLLVGHAPVLADRVRKLLGLKNPEALSLPKCGMACLEIPQPHSASLVWLISPALVGAKV